MVTKFFYPNFRLLVLLLFVNQGYAQTTTCNCKSDLEFLNGKVKKIPAFRNNKEVYNALYTRTLADVENVNSVYNCFVLLNRLMLGLNDNHSKLYGIDKGATVSVKNDPVKYSDFKKSTISNLYPKADIDLDSLKTKLTSMPRNQVEGVYSKKDYLTIGIFRDEGEDYKGIVLDSKSEVWQPGEIMYTLIPYGNDYFLNVGGDLASKRLIAYTERIEHGFFLTMGFQKDLSRVNYAQALYRDSNYVRKELSPEITYLKIGTFNSWNPTLNEADRFYKSLEGTLTSKNLIVDLRDNGGGGERNSNVLFRILKDYLKNNKIYLITNHRTASNAEQFALKLSKFQNCEIFGARTNGTVAYELTGDNFNLPCNNFLATLASKKHTDYLNIESMGIQPMVSFSMDRDWIQQMLNYIYQQQEGGK